MGTPALREAFMQFIAIDPKITVTSHEVIQADDIALHSSTWKMSGVIFVLIALRHFWKCHRDIHIVATTS